jgi:flagellar biosynthesis anti-sigma factor FlgM
MRIATIQAAYNAHQINQTTATGRTGARGRASDSVSISAAASDYATALRAISAAPDVREGFVSRIRDMIDAGTYSVPSRDVAARILQE